jgi:ubiquinone biosynthesis monooxygenase Coq7
MRQLSTLDSSHLDIKQLIDILQQLRDDELEHLDIAVEQMSQCAPAHALLSYIVGGGCKLAIGVCKKY